MLPMASGTLSEVQGDLKRPRLVEDLDTVIEVADDESEIVTELSC